MSPPIFRFCTTVAALLFFRSPLWFENPFFLCTSLPQPFFPALFGFRIGHSRFYHEQHLSFRVILETFFPRWLVLIPLSPFLFSYVSPPFPVPLPLKNPFLSFFFLVPFCPLVPHSRTFVPGRCFLVLPSAIHVFAIFPIFQKDLCRPHSSVACRAHPSAPMTFFNVDSPAFFLAVAGPSPFSFGSCCDCSCFVLDRRHNPLLIPPEPSPFVFFPFNLVV